MRRLKSFKFGLPVLLILSFWAGAVLSPITMPWAEAASDEDYQSMRLFTEVLAEIQSKYVEEKSVDILMTDALKGMVSSLDPHSAYLTPEEFKELQEDTKGSFSGIGIEITPKDGILTVVSPIEGTPADVAGVRAGDQIIKIDGKFTKSMSFTEAVKAIRGERGTKVTLSLGREGESQLREITIVRDVIPIHSVRFNLLEDGYGYVRIVSFQDNTSKDLIKALQTLQSQPTPLKGLVLDLRNDPGGLLQEAVHVADQFLTDGVIVTTSGRASNQQMVFRTSVLTTAENYPIVCLVNNGSASASEIVAGALQDHKRAIIMGTTTFGKGSVQTVIPLEDKGALKLTTALYYTPSGRSIQAEGIEPDMVVPVEIPKESVDSSQEFREKDIRGAMPSQSPQRAGNAAQPDNKLLYPAEKFAVDNQLQRALDQLKLWHVYFGSYLPAPGANATR
jgi:carboxyl-terminal processing protease